MISLPNGCSCSNLSVIPKNWEKKGASLDCTWMIHYRFYDPQFPGKPKLVRIKGMNQFKDLSTRRDATRKLLEYEMDLLTRQGYNPITGNLIASDDSISDIGSATPFLDALNFAYARLEKAKSTMADIKSVILAVSKAARALQYTGIPIGEIKRRHIRALMNYCQTTNARFSADRFNKFRSYLMILYKELVELEAVEVNPMRDISKQKTVRRIRVTLTKDERSLVDVHLRSKSYTFWRFLHIFFHSGSRITELIRLQGKDIDLSGQRFKRLVKKGRNYTEVWTAIKDVAFPLWEEVMATCGPDDFIFSDGLVPGARQIRSDQVTKRWNRHVKASAERGGLGIAADFYSLKHLNTDETAAILGINAAMRHNGHTSTRTTMIYAIGQKDRELEELKKVGNKFV
jgi:integrase